MRKFFAAVLIFIILAIIASPCIAFLVFITKIALKAGGIILSAVVVIVGVLLALVMLICAQIREDKKK